MVLKESRNVYQKVSFGQSCSLQNCTQYVVTAFLSSMGSRGKECYCKNKGFGQGRFRWGLLSGPSCHPSPPPCPHPFPTQPLILTCIADENAENFIILVIIARPSESKKLQTRAFQLPHRSSLFRLHHKCTFGALLLFLQCFTFQSVTFVPFREETHSFQE